MNDANNPIFLQGKTIATEIQTLYDMHIKSGLHQDQAWEFTASILVGCLLELKIKTPLRVRLHGFKEAIERVQKDGVGLGRK